MLGAIAALFPIVDSVLDKVVGDKSERDRLKQEVRLEMMNRQSELLDAQKDIIVSEAEGEGWLQRSWRPITMLAFVGCVMGYWFGLTPPTLPETAVVQMFELVKIGLGGYVVGRSTEKITKIATGSGIVGNAKSALDKWRQDK